MTTKNETFSSRLKNFMKAEGITQEELAQKIGSKRESVAKIKDNPRYDTIMSILDAFPNLSADWLMKGKGSMYILESHNLNNAPVYGVNSMLGDNAVYGLESTQVEKLINQINTLQQQNEKLTNKLLELWK